MQTKKGETNGYYPGQIMESISEIIYKQIFRKIYRYSYGFNPLNAPSDTFLIINRIPVHVALEFLDIIQPIYCIKIDSQKI